MNKKDTIRNLLVVLGFLLLALLYAAVIALAASSDLEWSN